MISAQTPLAFVARKTGFHFSGSCSNSSLSSLLTRALKEPFPAKSISVRAGKML
jgi:hypothetical protein